MTRSRAVGLFVGLAALVVLLAATPGWAQSTRPVAAAPVLGSDASLHSISCPSSTVCYAAGAQIVGEPANEVGVVVGTNNGGLTWWNRPLNVGTYPINDIACSSTTSCYLVDDTSGVIVTTNGGATWAYVTVPDPSTDGSSQLNVIKCPSVTVCVATGQDDQAKPVVAATTDGGAHWTAQYGSTGGNALSCPSTSLCVSGGSTNSNASPPAESLLIDRSTDGSATWQQVLEYPDPPVTPIDDAISSLSCPSTSSCLAFGSTGEFGINNNQPPPPVQVAYSTADGGATWASRPLSTDFQASGPFKVDCPRVVDCYTIGQTAAKLPTIEESTNSGWVWHAETVPSGVTSLAAIACPTYFHCYAVGGTANPNTPVAIIATTDGGHTWKMQTTP